MASYKSAIEWIAIEDDTEFLDEPDSALSVTASMVANLWNKDHATVRKDLLKARDKFNAEAKTMLALAEKHYNITAAPSAQKMLKEIYHRV